MVHVRQGDEVGAREALARIQALPQDPASRALVVAALHLEIGELDEGFRCLEKLVQASSPDLAFHVRRIRAWPFPDAVNTFQIMAYAIYLAVFNCLWVGHAQQGAFHKVDFT